MLRRLSTLAAAVSLVLCAATCVLWARHGPAGGIVGERSRSADLPAGWAAAVEARSPMPRPPGHRIAAGELVWVQVAGYPNAGSITYTTQRVTPNGTAEFPIVRWVAVGGRTAAEVAAAVTAAPRFGGLSGSVDVQVIAMRDPWLVPFWVPAVTSAALPAAWVVAAARQRRSAARAAAGLCPACGYDLRATPGRCPECGKVPSPEARPV